MLYKNNKQLKTEFKKILLESGLLMSDIADRLGYSPQQLNNKFNNKRISFDDMQKFLNVAGYDLSFDFTKII